MTNDEIVWLRASIDKARLTVEDVADVKEADVSLSALASAFAAVGLVPKGVDLYDAVLRLVQEKALPRSLLRQLKNVNALLSELTYRLSAEDFEAATEFNDAYGDFLDVLSEWAQELVPEK